MFFLYILGCQPETKPINESTEEGEILKDEDGDGYLSDEDCDDSDPLIHPDTQEICDGMDNNCNNLSDEDVTETFYVDSDEDGFGNPNISTQACDVPSGYTANGNDCDDTQKQSYPGAEELCDNLDNDCNNEIDDGIGQLFYVDEDNDGFGDNDIQEEACDLRLGLSSISGDCDDTNAALSPASIEVCDGIDNNCNDEIDEETLHTFYRDFDEDSFGDPNESIAACEPVEGYVDNNGDCDDLESFVHPLMVEICDEFDNDCDGVTDENDAIDVVEYYTDNDGDGIGAIETPQLGCLVPETAALTTGDCDDENQMVHPFMIEICDEIDNDCDGVTDGNNVEGTVEYYIDNDGDGFGSIETVQFGCSLPSNGVFLIGDCDDNDAMIYSNMMEVCDEKDNDCNDEIDDNPIDILTYYTDSDSDGFGDSDSQAQGCTQPDGTSLMHGDCDDTDAVINPAMVEICDEKDNDCNDDVDEDSIDRMELFIDDDGDGFGADASMELHCTLLDGFVDKGGDCDDTEILIHPNQSELCFDSIDNNCDSLIDDGTSIDASIWYLDSDVDTYGDENESMSSCSQPDGYVDDNTDCDDDNNNIHPMADEYCNEVDDNCDEILDNDTAVDALIWYLDSDEDTYGDENESMSSCSQPDGYVDDNTDCDDSNPDLLDVCHSSSCQELLDFDPNTPSGTYTIEVEGTYFDVYCDMVTDGGGWTAVAKQINDGQSCDASTPKNTLTTVSDLSDGYSLWLVPDTMSQTAEEILFYDIPTDRWAVAELTDPARGFLSTELVDVDGTSNVVNVNMTIVRNSGYRTCGYNILDHAGQGYMFDFADGYGWHGTGFGLCRTTNPGSVYGAFYDSPLVNPNVASHSCISNGYYYISAGVVFYIR